MKFNPLVTGGYYSASDIYGGLFKTSTSQETIPESTEQEALANTDATNNVSPQTEEKHGSLLMWLVGIFVVIVVLSILK